jgi:hypothetical protein
MADVRMNILENFGLNTGLSEHRVELKSQFLVLTQDYQNTEAED